MVATIFFEVNAWRAPRNPLANAKTSNFRESSGRPLTYPWLDVRYP